MTIEMIEKLLPMLFGMTGPEATITAARAAADRLLDLADAIDGKPGDGLSSPIPSLR